jgi:hypothetical protein
MIKKSKCRNEMGRKVEKENRQNELQVLKQPKFLVKVEFSGSPTPNYAIKY